MTQLGSLEAPAGKRGIGMLENTHFTRDWEQRAQGDEGAGPRVEGLGALGWALGQCCPQCFRIRNADLSLRLVHATAQHHEQAVKEESPHPNMLLEPGIFADRFWFRQFNFLE